MFVRTYLRTKISPSQSVFVRGKTPTAILLPFFSRFLLLIPHIIRIFVAISTKRASAEALPVYQQQLYCTMRILSDAIAYVIFGIVTVILFLTGLLIL